MTLLTSKKLFAFLILLCGTIVVTMRKYHIQKNVWNGTLLMSLRNDIPLPKFQHVTNTTSLTAEDSEKTILELKKTHLNNDPKSLFVHPGASSMAFESSQVSRFFYRLPQSHHPSDKHRVHQKLNDSLPDLSLKINESKLILFYNPPSSFRKNVMPFCKEGLNTCPIKSCRCSIDVADLEKADAVIVDAVKLQMKRPMVKQPSQVWIFFALESPVHVSSLHSKSEHWRQMFNWTYTYRLDSDIAKPNDILLHRPVSRNYTAIAKKKTKSAVWLVSHCKTHGKRELFVKELKKYYNVDIFGKCGNRTKLDDATLLNQYRFYLSFENSLCFDYVTEKLFKTFSDNINIIPVVRGGADYDTMIPKGTFINTAHFKTPKELGKYLAFYENNITAYADYLQQNDQFINVGRPEGYKNSFCEICVKMHNQKLYGNWYTNIGEWYHDGTCKKPSDL